MPKNKKLLTNNYSLLTRRGFTMIEMVLVLAIISILAGAILVSVNSQRQKARQAKMLAELSGTLQPIMMCLSDGGTINSPHRGDGGGNICSISGYGTWPNLVNTGFESNNYVSTPSSSYTDGIWYFFIYDSSSRICCNASASKCGIIPITVTCNNSTAL